MAVGRYLRGLNAYDVLGNLIPGAIGLVIVMGFLPSPPIPDNIGEYGLFIIAAFGLGAVIQEYASRAVGSRRSFNETMDSVERLSLQYTSREEESEGGGQNDPPEEEEPDNDESEFENNTNSTLCSLFWKLHLLIGPLCGWWRTRSGEKMEDKILANRIWEHLIDTHEIPFETTSYSVLYHVMLSRIDNIRSPSRAIRIQAIRNFHRGMWLTSWYATLLILLAVVLNKRLNTGDDIPVLQIKYAEPAYFDYWMPVWHLAVVSFIGVIIFWFLSESSEKDYLEYLFADYAVSKGSEETNITVGEESALTISGDITTQIDWEDGSDTESTDEAEEGGGGEENHG